MPAELVGACCRAHPPALPWYCSSPAVLVSVTDNRRAYHSHFLSTDRWDNDSAKRLRGVLFPPGGNVHAAPGPALTILAPIRTDLLASPDLPLLLSPAQPASTLSGRFSGWRQPGVRRVCHPMSPVSAKANFCNLHSTTRCASDESLLCMKRTDRLLVWTDGYNLSFTSCT